ncbi:Endoplasmic reticulum metallopeptidase 1 [Podochytrium sp. JEL0797]|nr:Endoplasmic reticulum metallopeptidase 1 [Podochytrium sp. JEL0797]
MADIESNTGKTLKIHEEVTLTSAIENIRASFMVLFVLVVALVMAGFRMSNEAAVPLDFQTAVSTSGFPGADAYSMLKEIAQIPHPIYSAENIRIYNLLLITLNEYKNASVVPMEVMEFDTTLDHPQLFAYFPGTTNSTVLVSSHFDSREMSPGASDDGSGTVVMMQLAKLFANGHGFNGANGHRNSLLLFFNNGEESHPNRTNPTQKIGRQGSRNWVKSEEWRGLLNSVRMFLNLEAGGAGGKPILLRCSIDKLTEVFSTVPYPHMNSFGGAFIEVLKSATDYEIYEDYGIPGLDLAFYQNRRYYHTADDSLDNISPTDIQFMGANSLAIVRSVIDAEWVDALRVESSAPFFSLFEGSPMIVYHPIRITLVVVLALCLVVLFWLGYTSYKRDFASVGLYNLVRLHLAYNTLACISGVVCGGLAMLVPFVTGFYSSHAAMTGIWTVVPLCFIGCIVAGYIVSAFWFRNQAANLRNMTRDSGVLSFAGVVPGTIIALVLAALNAPLMYIFVFAGVARLAALSVWFFKPFVSRSLQLTAVSSEIAACTLVSLVSIFPALTMLDAVHELAECTLGTQFLIIAPLCMGMLGGVVALPGFLGFGGFGLLRRYAFWGSLVLWVVLSLYALIISLVGKGEPVV